MRNKVLDPRLRGDDELISASLERCNLAYLKDLHLHGDFALHQGLSYDE